MANHQISDIILYQTEDGRTRIEVRLQDESVWLTQKMMSTLYQKDVRTINEHIKNIYAEGEQEAERTIRKFRIVRKEGQRQVSRHIDFYNLEMILAVGYRVRSSRGTQFRRWATERLNEYLVKGFSIDDERLKHGINIGSDYFDELLERIRDIRASEKRFYQKIRDIYKLAVDYDPKAKETQEFFQTVQNKLHFAITGKTAAEIIAERANSKKPNMGLTSWKGTKVRRRDVTVAKNYLNEEELLQLNRIITMYLDYAEDQANRHLQIYMRDWRDKLDTFLQFNERDILDNPGRVAKEVADKLALAQCEAFHSKRLEQEAKDEAVADDEKLKEIEHTINQQKKDRERK